uniref:Uncharacterized protein n=1 Tax=Oryza meridionalis TaxID=40149 RepID=A0A0E0CPV2_9ORYZ
MPWQCQVLLLLPSDMASAPSTGFDGDGDRIVTYARFSGPKLRGLRIRPPYRLIYRTKRGRHNHVASVARSPDLTSGNSKMQRQCSTMKSFKGLVREDSSLNWPTPCCGDSLATTARTSTAHRHPATRPKARLLRLLVVLSFVFLCWDFLIFVEREMCGSSCSRAYEAYEFLLDLNMNSCVQCS